MRWRHFSTAQKIEHLIGLDRCYEILSWPPAGLDLLRLSLKMQVIRTILRIGAKAMLDGTFAREVARERNRPRVLAALLRRVQELDRVQEVRGKPPAEGARCENYGLALANCG
jgi:hypothetical protein